MKNSMKISLCAVLASISTILMFLTGIIPVATLAIPAIAGCFVIPAVAHIGVKWGVMVYVTAAAACFLLVPDREAFLFYLLFFGYYPIIYGVFSRTKNKALTWALKLAVFNTAAIAQAIAAVYILGIPFESLMLAGNLMPYALLLVLNLVFVVYDIGMGRVIGMYISKLYPHLKRILR